VPLDAFLDRRLLIIAGKGGVGKTTIAAVLGMVASRHGKRVVIAEVEGKGSLSALFEIGPLTPEPTEVRPDLFAMNISPEEALQEYFDVQLHMKTIARPLITSQLVYYVTHAAPGLRDILMLGKLWYAATRKKQFDLIVLDTPAAGHAVSMLRSPEGFLHAVPVGPLAGHSRQVLEWLRDPNEVSIHLVSIAEEMPVNETIETTRLLEDRVEMDVAGVFLNMLYPEPADDPELIAALERLTGPGDLSAIAATSNLTLDAKDAAALFQVADFYRARREIQKGHKQTLIKELQQTAPIIEVPFLFRDRFGSKELDLLADAIEAQLQ
jgi:anion-transporting  ArsA/GET3 family ATPase